MIDYYDMLDQDRTSEADDIIATALNELRGLITKEAQKSVDEARKAKEELSDLKINISAAKRVLNELNEEIEQKKQYKITEVPKNIFMEFVRQYTDNYAPGDKVFFVREKIERCQCPKCSGSKEIFVYDRAGKELTVQCPACHGYGTFGKSSYHVIETRIRDIHLRLCFNERGSNIWNTDNVFVEGCEYAVNPKWLFRKRDDAEACANMLNKEEEAKNGN